MCYFFITCQYFIRNEHFENFKNYPKKKVFPILPSKFRNSPQSTLIVACLHVYLKKKKDASLRVRKLVYEKTLKWGNFLNSPLFFFLLIFTNMCVSLTRGESTESHIPIFFIPSFSFLFRNIICAHARFRFLVR